MAGLLIERVRCWMRGGHTFAVQFRHSHGRPVMGYVCVECLRWKRSPFAPDTDAA